MNNKNTNDKIFHSYSDDKNQNKHYIKATVIDQKEFEDMINKIMSTELFYEELKYF